MLFYLTLIFCCQLVGELFIATTGLPVPGPVVGMAILFLGLLVRGSVPEDLGKVADTLISNLSLLFVPAGVGVMLHAGLIAAELVPITVALVLSTILTIAATGICMSWLGARARASRKTVDGGGD
jgi:holin-like protein